MARPRTPAAETPPAAPPLVSKDSLPPVDTFRDYRKTAVTRIAGPFEPPVEVMTVQGPITVTEPTFIGLDSEEHPYPIAPDVLAATYALVDFGDEPGAKWPVEPSIAAEELDQIRKAAFEEGVAEGIRRASAKEVPLFEAAKQLARMATSEQGLRELLEQLQTDREEMLSVADRDLILAVYRRQRARVAQREEARRTPGQPRRSPQPATIRPAQTEYEHIS